MRKVKIEFMTPHDLAWKGTTPAEKRDLLNHAVNERNRLVEERKSKDGHLGLASACVDIIGTAKAALNEIQSDNEATLRPWRNLLSDAEDISKKAVEAALSSDQSDWVWSDYEVAGTIFLKTEGNDVTKVEKARLLFLDGLAKAKEAASANGIALLSAQLVQVAMALKSIEEIKSAKSDLLILLSKEEITDPKVLTRLYRTDAQAGKLLAILYAREAGSENQELKARNI